MRNQEGNDQCLEARFLLAVLRTRNDAGLHSCLKEFSRCEINWNKILNLGYAHGLIPLLYLKLKSAPSCYFPQEFSKYLENHYRANELRNRMLREEFVNIIGAFDKGNIRAIPLKGIVYSQTLYDNSSGRQFVDIDFLLKEEDIDTAKQLLEEQGYHTVYMQTELAEGNSKLTTLQESIYRSVYHEYALQSSDRLINIDLHWRLSPRIYPTELSPDLISLNLVPSVINGVKVRILSDEMDLIYLCMHAAKDGWCELKWAVDISELVKTRNMLQWNKIWQFCWQLRCKKMVLVGLALAHWVTGVELPEDVVTEISLSQPVQVAANDLQRRLLTKPDRKFSRVPCLMVNTIYLQLCDSQIDKVKYIFRVLTYAQAKDFNVLGLNDRLLPIWPLLRPLRIAAHCTRKYFKKLLNV